MTGSSPDDLDRLIEGAVEAGVFTSKSDALREFAREYFDDHDEERVAAAVTLYEREISTLGDAARLAGVNRFEMQDILEIHGVDRRIGLTDEAEVDYEVEVAQELEYADAAHHGDESEPE